MIAQEPVAILVPTGSSDPNRRHVMGRSLWAVILRGIRKVVPDWETLGLCWGSISVGAVSLPPIPPTEAADPPATPATDASLSGPPSGHPERVDPSAPLSEVERALWSQLT
ncbi:DUF6059 family protein [Streptomyces sp. NPDC006450]|uniref:DUF6059 family protein n=1 Tax=Streptomyces sp. NPDC006450 TaxID=3155458 RepID=UPI0033BD2F43